MMEKQELSTIHPKAKEWVLIVDGIKEAFDSGYKGKWTLKHHRLIGRLVQVHNVEQFPSAIIVCYPRGGIKGYLEFPSPYCVQRLGIDVPEGWYPAKLPPAAIDERYYLNQNVYIGLLNNKALCLMSYIENSWYYYVPGFKTIPKGAIIGLKIIAYQPIPHFPIKRSLNE